MTKARKSLLAVLKEAVQPLSVADLVANPQIACNQATVYRSLRYLEQQGYVDSFVLHCTDHGTERYYCAVTEKSAHSHWFHCTVCHRFTDVGSCLLTEDLRRWESQYGFSITDHTFFLTGVCQTCKELTTSTG